RSREACPREGGGREPLLQSPPRGPMHTGRRIWVPAWSLPPSAIGGGDDEAIVFIRRNQKIGFVPSKLGSFRKTPASSSETHSGFVRARTGRSQGRPLWPPLAPRSPDWPCCRRRRAFPLLASLKIFTSQTARAIGHGATC